MAEEQRRLFEEPAPWEEDGQGERLVATVVFVGGAPGEYDYLVPDALAGKIEPGRRVRVPLGKGDRLIEAYCVRVEVKPPGRFRPRRSGAVADGRTLISPR